MSTSPRQSRRLKFKNLPLIEAAVRISLETPLQLSFGAINALHQKIRKDFPDLTEPDRFEVPPGITKGMIQIRPGNITGATYAGNPDGLRVTLQQQVISARWLKQRGDDAPDYPHFEKLRAALWSCLDACNEVLAEELTVVVVNMFYVNLIPCENPSEILERYFVPEAHIGVFKERSARAIQKVEFAWQEPDLIDLRFALDGVTVETQEQRSSAYKLTTASGVVLAGRSNPDSKVALEDLHARLQSFFEQVISERARKEWGLGDS